VSLHSCGPEGLVLRSAGVIYTGSLTKIAEHGGFNPGTPMSSRSYARKCSSSCLLKLE